MKKFKSTNPVCGYSGPFEAESRELVIKELYMLLETWGRDLVTDVDYVELTRLLECFVEGLVEIYDSEFPS